jgi:hypothetical protein
MIFFVRALLLLPTPAADCRASVTLARGCRPKGPGAWLGACPRKSGIPRAPDRDRRAGMAEVCGGY